MSLKSELTKELAASIKAIEQGLADIEAGRVRPFQEFISELRND